MANDNFTAPAAPANSSSVSTFDYLTEGLATALNTYYTPLLVLLGCIGNIISVYVFISSKLRMQSTSLYLSVLSVSDTVFLLQLLPPWLNAMQITSLFNRSGFCEIFVYSFYASCCTSAWVVVAFTIERFVAVLYPLRRSSMCTVARAKTVIALLVLASMITNLPVIKYASPSVNDCNIDLEYVEYAARFNLADTVVSFTLPLGIIVLLNIRIMCGVWQYDCERRALETVQAACPESLSPPVRALPPLRSQQRVTRMLLIVSTVFVVLNLPAYTMRLLAYAYEMSSGEYSGRWAALQQLALMCFHTNFGINFILYCLSGQNFRRELCLSISYLRNRTRRSDDMQLVCRTAGRTGSVTTSYVSGAEASTSAGPNYGQAPSRVQRHHSEPFIERWTFNNSRTLRAQTQLAGHPHTQSNVRSNRLHHAPPHALPAPRDIEAQEIGEVPLAICQREEEDIERPFPYVLFPLARIINPRSRRSSSLTDGTPSN